MYACPRKARKRKGVKGANSPMVPPKKIPFPRLVAGTWLGVFHVRWSTVVFAFFCEFAATFAYGVKAPGLSFMFIVGMFAAVFWAGVTSEVYNIDVVNGRISKTLLFFGRELAEWGVAPLRDIKTLLVRADESTGGYKRQLSALLVDGSFLDLTPPYDVSSDDELAVSNLLDRIREGTTIPIADKTLPENLSSSEHAIPTTKAKEEPK